MEYDSYTSRYFTVVNQTRLANQELTHARELLGQLFHTLQDFYSHSNWIEMGKTDVNTLIGINETIGIYAGSNQSTCTSDGCTKIEKPCVIIRGTRLYELILFFFFSCFRLFGNRLV